MKGRKSWAMAYCGMAAALSIAFMLLGAVIPIFMYIAPAIAIFNILYAHYNGFYNVSDRPV